MPYDAILFDFDGVLIDSEPVHFECWRELLEPLGVDMDWETYADQCIGVADYEMLKFLGGRSDPPVPAERLWQEYGKKNKLFLERVIADPPVASATRKLLAEDLNGYKLGVVSSSGRAEVEPILVASGLKDHFQALVCGGDVVNHKPHPEPYIKAAHLLQAQAVLVVEDSEPGEASGHAAGFDVVRIRDAEQTAELVLQQIAEHGR